MNANGPAIKGGCVTRREHRAESRYFSQKIVTVQGGYGTRFCSPGTKLVEHYECRGAKLIASHIFITGYRFYALQWCDPGLSPVTKLSWAQELIAKTVTSNLPLLSVLGFRSNFCYSSGQKIFFFCLDRRRSMDVFNHAFATSVTYKLTM